MGEEMDKKTRSQQDLSEEPGIGYRIHKALNRTANSALDLGFIVAMIFLLIAAAYVNWDSMQVYTAADPVQYLQYKPRVTGTQPGRHRMAHYLRHEYRLPSRKR